MSTTEMVRADEFLRDIEQPAMPTSDVQPSLVQNPYVGIAAAPFPPEAAEILMQPVAEEDVEIRPDGLIYLPEIKYRRILNRAFGPGAWSLLPIEIIVAAQDNMLYYKGALIVHGRFVSEAIGEQQYFPENDRMSYATAAESAKSNCLMRCCKDLGIASELWDPVYIRKWIATYATDAWCTNVGNGRDAGKKRKMWRKKSAPRIDMYPWREEAGFDAPNVEITEPSFTRGSSNGNGHSNGNGSASYGSSNGSSGAGARSNPGAVISFKQAKRFLAIAREHGWSDEEIKRLLGDAGFATADDITRGEYDRLCTALEDSSKRSQTREMIERGNAASAPADDFDEQLPF